MVQDVGGRDVDLRPVKSESPWKYVDVGGYCSGGLRFRHIQSPDYSGLFAFLGPVGTGLWSGAVRLCAQRSLARRRCVGCAPSRSMPFAPGGRNEQADPARRHFRKRDHRREDSGALRPGRGLENRCALPSGRCCSNRSYPFSTCPAQQRLILSAAHMRSSASSITALANAQPKA